MRQRSKQNAIQVRHKGKKKKEQGIVRFPLFVLTVHLNVSSMYQKSERKMRGERLSDAWWFWLR